MIDLKQNVRTAEQQMRLDSLYLLLGKKEHLLITVTDIYNKLAEIDETVKEKIPAIATHIQQSSRQLENIPPANITEDKPKKERTFGISSAKKKGNPLTAKQGNRKQPNQTLNPYRNLLPPSCLVPCAGR